MGVRDVQYIKHESSRDLRGISCQIYTNSRISDFECNELFVSHSKRNVVRGIHVQTFPYGQKKIITLLEGCIEGVILDLREFSDTYQKVQSVQLNDTSGYSILVPEYCAWGFHALSENNVILYNISGEYKKEYDMGVRWNSINYDWKIENPLLSERDKNLISLEEYIRRQKSGTYKM